MTKLKLPQMDYGPFCLRILKEFVDYYDLPKNLEFPQSGISTHEALSRIFDIILHSLPKEKQKEILEALDKYKMEIPAALR